MSEKVPIHSQAYWEAVLAEFDQQLNPYRGMHAENMDFIATTNLFSVMMQQLGHLTLVARELALEAAPKSRGRSAKAQKPQTKEPSQAVVEGTAERNPQQDAWQQMLNAAHAIAEAFAGVNDEDIVNAMTEAATQILTHQWSGEDTTEQSVFDRSLEKADMPQE